MSSPDNKPARTIADFWADVAAVQEEEAAAARALGCQPYDCKYLRGDGTGAGSPCYHCSCPDRRHEIIEDGSWDGLADYRKETEDVLA